MIWRHTPRDRRVLGAALALALAAPLLPWLSGQGLWGMSLAPCLFGLVVWWTSNTLAHVHIHTPIFRARAANRGFTLLLGLLTGVPQAVWRHRHLAHHRGAPPGPLRLDRLAALDTALVAHLWLALAGLAPRFFLTAWLPGWLLGMALCALQGRGEHLAGRSGGIDHRGRLHNRLWLNDGWHAEHHRWPGAHWTELPARALADAPCSRRTPVVRALLPWLR